MNTISSDIRAILWPLKQQKEHVEYLHQMDPENELHEHVAALFGYVYGECLQAAGRRGYDLEGEPVTVSVVS
jgi:hypothetical protein